MKRAKLLASAVPLLPEGAAVALPAADIAPRVEAVARISISRHMEPIPPCHRAAVVCNGRLERRKPRYLARVSSCIVM